MATKIGSRFRAWLHSVSPTLWAILHPRMGNERYEGALTVIIELGEKISEQKLNMATRPIMSEDTVKSLPWISVEERLPENTDLVYLWLDGPTGSGDIGFYENGIWLTSDATVWASPWTVTHWLPITPPITLDEGQLVDA